MTKTRTYKAKINFVVTLITHFLQILMGFIIRKLFIKKLGIDYLGYNSVFTNILQMLNLADMGVGVAITSYLYKPLADNDKDRISSIMFIYKKIYFVIGFVVLIMGVIVSIFLETIIPDATCSIIYLRFLFYINLFGTVSTYYLAYKRTLIIADQKAYFANIIDTTVNFIISIIQILFLFIYPNYVLYLLLTIIKNIISNILISKKVNNDYKYINNEPNIQYIDNYKPLIIKYVKDVFISRIGAVVYYSTDNVILSILNGSLLVGYLSNYTMITNQLNTIVLQVFSSVQSTFGNFINSTQDKSKQIQMTDNYLCLNFCIGNFCFICFTLLVQPFIHIFFGKDMVLQFTTAMWLGINMMLTFMLQLPSQVFTIYKLFKYDKVIIIISIILNIVISVCMVKIIGINGVLVGTFVTSLIYLFSRFYIISKYLYRIKYLHYIKKIIFYFLISFITFIITYELTKNINANNILSFCFLALCVIASSIFTTASFLFLTKEFKFLKRKLLEKNVQ